ncbi:hypothetical protein [Pontibacter flavimaris]|uniref:Uncharacterized protein n=1 Tax=Pontibacter flavimaris TaxID=1797110 RepID=A0A1Q5PC46_9BACT|nr:hypothetical protein [Pontibacter flavimaris]OKL39767.1 hypothetical protein A3841_00650 [Pontibacter flavimaris]
MKTLRGTFFWVTTVFFFIVAFSLTIGQLFPIEFADWKYSHTYYDIVLQGFPVAVLLTLAYTMGKHRTVKQNIRIAVLTSIGAVASFFLSVLLMFSYGFGAWVNYEIVYESKENPREVISHQLWDNGAFGYGSQRTVKLTPFLGLWNIAVETDTATVNKMEWHFLKREGDIKIP